jgi:hypothetical protein
VYASRENRMTKSSVVPALTLEARLKRRLREHLTSLGFSKTARGALIAPGSDKDVIRALYQQQRRERLIASSPFLRTALPYLAGYFANGVEVDPGRIRLRLHRIRAGTLESELFRLATLTWSVPVSNGFGRRLRYLVWDDYNNKLVGIIAIGDPVFNLSVRDDLIGWTSKDRTDRLVNLMDAYVLGAVPPYNMLLGGKAIACLVRTRDIFNDFQLKYGAGPGIISGKRKNASLVAVTTSSSLGRSSVYNRLTLWGAQYFRPIGYTEGWGHFHIPQELFTDLRKYLRTRRHPYADMNRFGHGPNWRLRTIRVALKYLGLEESLLRHGLRRQVFLSQLADNALQILQTGNGIPQLNSLKSADQVSVAVVQRWMIPRAERKPEFRSWDRSELPRLLTSPRTLPYRPTSLAVESE